MQQSNNLVRLISSFDTVHLVLVEGLLVEAGIMVERRNFMLAAGAGDLPFIDVTPELWVAVRDHGLATGILDQLKQDEVETPPDPRACPRCGETIEVQFAQCWHCGQIFED